VEFLFLDYFVAQFPGFSLSACQYFDFPSLAWKLLKFHRCVYHRGRKADRRVSMVGFTKPLRPEFNFGKEKVKFW
jgi:hypothetical protein